MMTTLTLGTALRGGFSTITPRFISATCLLLCSLCLSTSLHALSQLKGSVHDHSGQPVAFANVLLLANSDSSLVKGAVTNESGMYEMEDILSGHYLVSVSMLGYSTAFLPLEVQVEEKAVELPPIMLQENAADLETVEIKAKKPLFEQQIDRLVINVQNSITAAGNTALDVLERSPGVVVNRENGSISMSGKGGVIIMIDGRINRIPMSALLQMLEGMPASNINRIELITTPPANFDAEGDAGFINILLKKNENEGMNGSATGSIGHGRKLRLLSGVNLNYRKNKVNVYGDYNFTRNRMIGLIDANRTVRNAGETIETNISTRRDGGFHLHNARLGADYFLSQKTVIGVLGSIYERHWSQESLNQADYFYEPGPDASHTGIRNDINNSHQYLFNFNLQHDFTRKQRLNFDVDYFDYYSHQPQGYDNRFYDERGQQTRNQQIRMDKKTPLHIWVSKLDYRINLNDQLKFETGVKTTLSDFENDVLTEFDEGAGWIFQDIFSESATFQENISAAYGSFDLKIDGKTAVKAGLRYEYTDTRLESTGENPSIVRQYGNLFPSIFVSRSLKKDQSIQLAYSRRITRPTFDQLAPFVLFLEPNTYATGNAALLPAITDQVKADYRIKSILLSVQYSVDNDAIARFQPKVDPASNLITYYSENIDKIETLALTFSLPVYVNNWWEMQNQLTARRMTVTSNFNDAAVNLSQNTINLNTTQTFRLPGDFTMEITGFYASAGLSGVSRSKALGSVAIGLQKKLPDNKGTFSLNATDIFRTQIFSSYTHIPELNLEQAMEVNFDTRRVTLAYTRSFGNNKVKSSRKRNTGAAEELRRVGE